jgi:hypothetical protein
MLSFAVFDSAAGAGGPGAEGPAREWPLRHAYLVGPDDVPVQADIRIVDGLIRCDKRTGEAAGLCVQYPVEPVAESPDGRSVGVVTLQTCLLPERERPYLLSVELARHRLMLILNKLEDWALFDVPAEEPAMVLFETARRAFTEAVAAQGGAGGLTLEADRLGRRALSLAIEASETLALTQARVQHGKRVSGELAAAAAAIATPANALTEHEAAESRNALIGNAGVILPTPAQVGCEVSQDQFSPQLQKIVAGCCDFICMPMRWVDMEPTEGKYAFAKTDRWIEWAVRVAKIPIVGGPVIDFRPRSVPEWLYIWEHDYETLRDLVYEHVKTIVTRYRRTVGTWTVASGLHVNGNFSFSFEQVMDLTRMCVLVVRKLQPGARVQIEIDQPWGEYYADNARSIPPVLYAEMVNQAGITADLFGVRIEMGQPEPGRSTRDLMAVSAMLDRYAALEKPIAVTALSAPAQGPDSETVGLARQLEPGYWRRPWDAEAQWRWMTSVIGVATSKPYVHSVCWRELYDPGRPNEVRHDGLISPAGHPTPALWRMAEICEALREKKSPLELTEAPAAPA